VKRYSIEIKALRISARLGWEEAERSAPQEIEIDASVAVDLPSGMLDQLSKTVDYASLIAAIKTLLSESEFRLIEGLSFCIARELFGAFPLIQSLDISIRKFIFPETESVSVRAQYLAAEFSTS